MSVRVYNLSEKLGITNAELIEILRSRGFVVKTASSTVDNISAESLVEEFTSKGVDKGKSESSDPDSEVVELTKNSKEEKVVGPSAAATSKGVDKGKSESSDPDSEVVELTKNSKEEKVVGPSAAAIVKTKEEVDHERQERIQAKRPKPAVVKPRVPGMIPPQPSSSPLKPISPDPLSVALPSKTDSKSQSSPVPTAARIPPDRDSQPTGPQRPQTAVPPKPVKSGEETKADSQHQKQEVAIDESQLKSLELKPPLVVRDFAGHLGLKPFRLISELMEFGIFASMNQVVEEDVAQRLARNHGYRLEVRHRGEKAQEEQEKTKIEEPEKKEAKALVPRCPIVCILGHVDHGKTTLLDTIRKTDVVAGEAGGITQHIGSYQIKHNGQKISFIDTPGHAAFSRMRARGTRITDIAVLVVAADDGFMPQTDEALGYIQDEGVPIVVAINKTDVPGANVDRVKGQMQDRNIAAEDWGGETLTVEISALKGERITDLLDTILLQAEVMEDLKANPEAPVDGIIIEAQKDVGQGANASLIVQNGTLQIGDALIAGPYFCKVRALFDDMGQNLKLAEPSTPVRVTGWSGPPESGAAFRWVKNDRVARNEAKENELEIRKQGQDEVPEETGATLENIFDAISKSQRKVFRVILKADVFGTAEALAECLEDIKSEKIILEVVQTAVGAISKNDVQMAHAAEAAVVGFNVNQESGVVSEAKHHGINIYRNNIIYELIDVVREAMADTLEPEKKENKIGVANIRQVFPVGKTGKVAGCMVVEGRIARDNNARLIRDGKIQVESKIHALKRFKDDASDVRSGYECGIRLVDYDDYREGDVIECFEIENVRPTL
ncbi:MAG: Translation initiation factor IF-2 [Candidatus Moanabacter tarae]|uniref:Translation initiation factor IF-2 n=1 Tax=Candidatus Moanibacter tarae TaxID=2200854 RepID=A0A2Z4AD96_9BACT|nr:MAG: Translation initiation factor IF-2 [Candidatus Moanabacter tarae]